MTETEARITRIHDHLTENGPWSGHGTDLARELGMSYYDFVKAVYHVRSHEWMEEHGWTIPYVGRGGSRGNAYAVVGGRDAAREHLQPGAKLKTEDVLGEMRRLDAHLGFGIETLNPASPEYGWSVVAAAQIRAMVTMADHLMANGSAATA